MKPMFIPPPSVFDKDEEKGLGLKKFWKVLTGREFLVILLGTAVCCGGTAFCLFISYGFFSLLVNILTIVACFLIFATFVFAQSSYLDGFFAMLGTGYLFVGTLIIVSKSLTLGLIPTKSSVEFGDASVQIELYIRFVEMVSWGLGLILAHRSFRGWKLLVGYLVTLLVFTAFVLLSIFQWDVFPETAVRSVTSEDGEEKVSYRGTTFRYVVAALWPPWFLVLAIALLWRRKHFTENVVIFLFVALILRIINLIFNAILRDFEESALDVLQLITRMASFVFIYLSVGTSVLRDPMKTLFYSLNLKQAALKNQSLVVSWMIDQVPSICILLDDEGIVGHVNKFALSKLKCNPREPLINTSFLQFLQFDSEEERSKLNKEFRDLVKERIPTNYVVFKSKGTQVEKDRVIEWTFKMVKSAMPLQSSSSSEINSSSDIEMSSISKKSSSHGGDATTITGDEDEQISVLCLGRDITDEIEREKFLTEARNNAERLALMQENFVANTSHELRTPLNCIVGVTDLLLMQNFNESDNEMITMIKTSANSLLTLINDLLEFAKLKQGKMNLTYGMINLRLFVENCVSSMNVLYEKGNIEFCYWIARDCPEAIRTDDNRVRQILFNLLSNAVKFTPKGHIILTVKALRIEGKETVIQFRVSDSGIGISQEDIQNLFLRFFQVERHIADRKPGTGIGLSISKQLVELMGGSINVTSELGVGTTFTFSIPAGALSQLQAGAEKNPRGSAPPVDCTDIYTTPRQVVYVCLRNPSISATIAEATRKDYGFECASLDDISMLNHSIKSMDELQPSSLDPSESTCMTHLSLLIEPLDLQALALETLQALHSKGVVVQIIFAIPHSAPNIRDTSDPRLREFKIGFVRKPFSISKISHALRIVDPPANRPHRPPSFDSFTKRSRSSSVSSNSHSSNSFAKRSATSGRGRGQLRVSLTGMKNPMPSNASVSSIHTSNTSSTHENPKSATPEKPDSIMSTPLPNGESFSSLPLKNDQITTVQNSANFTQSISPLHTGHTPELRFSAPPSHYPSPTMPDQTPKPSGEENSELTFQPVSFGANPISFAPVKFSAPAVFTTKSSSPSSIHSKRSPSPVSIPSALLNPSTPPSSVAATQALSQQNQITPPSPSTTPKIRDLRILIVEDDKTNQKVLQLMLKRITGVVYQIAENGKEGLEKFLESHENNLPYDCIFMDSQMPVMDGETATSEIRRIEMERPEIGHTHVTALTANALMDEKNQLFRTLVDDYLTKPITFNTFSSKLQSLKDLLTPIIVPLDEDYENLSDLSEDEGVIAEEPI